MITEISVPFPSLLIDIPSKIVQPVKEDLVFGRSDDPTSNH